MITCFLLLKVQLISTLYFHHQEHHLFTFPILPLSLPNHLSIVSNILLELLSSYGTFFLFWVWAGLPLVKLVIILEMSGISACRVILPASPHYDKLILLTLKCSHFDEMPPADVTVSIAKITTTTYHF